MAEIFQPGDRAPCSGMYRVVHALRHAASHQVIALYNDTFPCCLECIDEVRFELTLSAVYLSAHPCFHCP
jgi:hypothetical protein